MRSKINDITIAVSDLKMAFNFYKIAFGFPAKGIQNENEEHYIFDLDDKLTKFAICLEIVSNSNRTNTS